MTDRAFMNEMQGSAETMSRQTRDVMKTYIDVNRRAYEVFFGNAQSLAAAQLENARKYYDAVFSRLNEARDADARDIVMMPLAMAPDSRDTLLTACNEARSHFRKTHDELQDVLRDGYQDILGALTATGAPGNSSDAGKTAAPARKPATAAKRKTTSTPRASSAAAKAEKQA